MLVNAPAGKAGEKFHQSQRMRLIEFRSRLEMVYSPCHGNFDFWGSSTVWAPIFPAGYDLPYVSFLDSLTASLIVLPYVKEWYILDITHRQSSW